MCNGDNLDVVEAFAEDDRKRISINEGTARKAQVGRTDVRTDFKFAICSAEFLIESKGGGLTPIP